MKPTRNMFARSEETITKESNRNLSLGSEKGEYVYMWSLKFTIFSYSILLSLSKYMQTNKIVHGRKCFVGEFFSFAVTIWPFLALYLFSTCHRVNIKCVQIWVLWIFPFYFYFLLLQNIYRPWSLIKTKFGKNWFYYFYYIYLKYELHKFQSVYAILSIWYFWFASALASN